MTKGSIHQVTTQGYPTSHRGRSGERVFGFAALRLNNKISIVTGPFSCCLPCETEPSFDRIFEGGLASPSTYTQGYPSGQRGWAQDPLLSASQVRILLPAL